MREQELKENELASGDYVTQRALCQTMETFYMIYGNPEYNYETILGDTSIKTYDERIDAFEAAIRRIGEKEGLDFKKAREGYEEALKAGKFKSFSDYFTEMSTTMNESERLSLIGARALETVELHREESELIRNDPEYAMKMYEYHNKSNREDDMREWGWDRFDDLTFEEMQSWGMDGEEILDENSVTVRKQGMGSDLLGVNRKVQRTIENSKEESAKEESAKEENTQLQTTDNNSIWQIIKNKASKIMEFLKNIFKGNKDFEGEVINPADNILEESTNENPLEEKEVSSFKEIMNDKINNAKRDRENMPFMTNGLSNISELDRDSFEPIPNAQVGKVLDVEQFADPNQEMDGISK